MRPHRYLTALCTLPLVLSTTGCNPEPVIETVQILMQDEDVRKAVISAAENVFVYTLRKAAEILKNAADAATPDTVKCTQDTPAEVVIVGAQGAAGVATEQALKELDLHPNEDPRRLPLTIRCYRDESTPDCQRRAKAVATERFEQLTNRLSQNAIANVQLTRATGFVETWPSCRDQVDLDSGADTIPKVVEAVDICMTKKGFGEEIAAINTLFPNAG
jgi:hypothetical protein